MISLMQACRLEIVMTLWPRQLILGMVRPANVVFCAQFSSPKYTSPYMTIQSAAKSIQLRCSFAVFSTVTRNFKGEISPT